MKRFPMTSLLPVEERLRETVYWEESLRAVGGYDFAYRLNAYLSAARSVTFLLQKELSHVAAFGPWWKGRQDAMRADASMRFFHELRNISQKQGPVRVAGSRVNGPEGRLWVFAFVGNDAPVPDTLRLRGVADCCREHNGKLARLLLECMEALPAHCCYARAMTPEHVATLGLSLEDIEESIGYRRGYSDIGGATVDARLYLLARSFDAVDVDWLEEIARMEGEPDSQRLDAMLVAMVRRTEVGRTNDPAGAATANPAG